MDDLVIYGAGGLGRELLEIVEDINRARESWRMLGFIDDGAKHGGSVNGYPLLGGFDFLKRHAGRIGVIIAFANCPAKEAAYKKIKERCPNAYFPVIVHPGSYVSPRAALAEGVVVARFCFVSVDSYIGKCAVICNKSEVAHDSTIGDFCSLMPAVNVSGNVTVGERVFVGVRAAVLQGLTVGSDSVVGMGSVVIKDVPPGRTVVGHPAKAIPWPHKE